jgi:hypothetical protein
MELGPLELLVVKFPGNQFRGEIIPELKKLVEAGTIRVVDILFLRKGREGEVSVLEINDLDDEDFAGFDPIVSDLTGLLSEDDVDDVAAALEENSSAAIMLFEQSWAIGFRDAVLRARGELVYSERIPQQAVEAVLASKSA